MLKPSSPSPETEDPAGGEADGTDTAKSQGGTASRDAKVPRRYEVPEADALSELPNRPHAQTVRGQIQRVRLDLLARENERLDHQLRELRQQQDDYQGLHTDALKRMIEGAGPISGPSLKYTRRFDPKCLQRLLASDFGFNAFRSGRLMRSVPERPRPDMGAGRAL